MCLLQDSGGLSYHIFHQDEWSMPSVLKAECSFSWKTEATELKTYELQCLNRECIKPRYPD